MQSDLVEFAGQFRGARIGHVDEEQVLQDSGAQFAASEVLGEFGGLVQLIAAHAAAENRGAHVAEAGLLLRVNADVVAIDIVGHLLVDRGIELESDDRFKFREERIRGPAFLEEEIFQAGAVATFAESLLLAEDFGNAVHDGDRLIGTDKGVQLDGEMRLIREAAADAN